MWVKFIQWWWWWREEGKRAREREIVIEDYTKHLPSQHKIKARSEKGKPCALFDSSLLEHFTNAATGKSPRAPFCY